MARFVLDLRLERRLAHHREEARDHLEHRQRRFGAEVERLPREPVARHPLGQLQVGVDGILDVEVVADERPVAPNDRPLVLER